MKSMLAEIARSRAEAARVQQQRQQGFGKPIVATEANGVRFIAVKNRVFPTESFRTFHDFLMRYISVVLGVEWGNAELRKPLEQRHPLLRWYDALCRHQRKHMTGERRVQSIPSSGATAAYLQLAYDLYALDHNVELQDRLLKRLKNAEGFSAARYETYVAAILVRANFELVFENEEDGSTTHCEFTATYRPTGKKFSVEAKRRESARLRLGRLFNGALGKAAEHARVIFMDVNTRDDDHGVARPTFLTALRNRMRRIENEPLNGVARPSAYVLLTNTPWEHYLDDPAPRCTFLAEGFRIDEFKEDAAFTSLRSAIKSRTAHIEMRELLNSIRDHWEIPSTFDGEIPEFAFGQVDQPRLVVGSRYLVRDQAGVERPAIVTTAIVDEDKSEAICGVSFDNGGSGIWRVPLTPSEIAAWRRHPDTFFGVMAQRTTTAETPLELYDFIHAAMLKYSKEQLLEVLRNSPDFETLKSMEHSELASIRAERLTLGALAHGWTKRDELSEQPPER